MFCPKCGNQLPDNAQFCGNCGAQLATRNQQPAQATPFSATPQNRTFSQAGNFSTLLIAALAAVVLSVVFLFLPWIKIPLLDSGNALAQQLMGSYSTMVTSAFPSEYSIWGIGDAFEALGGMLSYTGADSSTLASLGTSVAMIRIMFVVLVVLQIVGIVMAVLGRGTKFLRVVALCIAAFALTWAATMMWLNSFLKDALHASFNASTYGMGAGMVQALGFSNLDFVIVTIWPFLTAILSIAAFVLADRDAAMRGPAGGIAPLALGSLLSALVGIGLLGLVCGIVSLMREKKMGVLKTNRTLSIVAIVIGALGLVGAIGSTIVVGAAIQQLFQ